ncbi:MAG TPA: endolytic transglycosylase MltG [Sediminibacterium sp.]|nr:endolytic transglycosylase MltG [Sediminibacterium sp.]
MKKASKSLKKRGFSPFLFIALFILLMALSGAWLFLGPATSFSEKSRIVTIREDETNKTLVLAAFSEAGILRFNGLLGLAGAPINLWDQLKPGKYEIKKGQSIVQIVRMLKNGRFAEVKLIINRVRTRAELARLISKTFPIDSVAALQYISSNDSLQQFSTDTSLLFTKIIPNTYSFYYDASLTRIFRKLTNESTAFWLKNNRIQKAAALQMTPEQVYTLASIVDEETNFESDKYKIASVYINRLKKQMPLQACPTIKYAMNDFTITRIYEKYLSNPSPYNTYKYKGLPPGPICTPAPKTIDIVLDAPATDYIYFVAKSDFSGYHHFSNNYPEHNRYANEYQKALDAYMLKKQEQKK